VKVKGWWVSPGRREFSVRLRFTVPWVWVERGLYEQRTVLWGARPGDVQAGGRADRQLEHYRRLIAQKAWQQRALEQATVRLSLALRDEFTPKLQALSWASVNAGDAMRRLERSYRSGRR
jgi:hypothetical protein